MSDQFTAVASIDYPIIDADAHVYEPPGVWQERVPARLRERAPKVLRTDEGDVWSFNDGERVRPIGLMAAAGASYLDFRPSGLTYETIRRGHFAADARLADMDADGIYLCRGLGSQNGAPRRTSHSPAKPPTCAAWGHDPGNDDRLT